MMTVALCRRRRCHRRRRVALLCMAVLNRLNPVRHGQINRIPSYRLSLACPLSRHIPMRSLLLSAQVTLHCLCMSMLSHPTTMTTVFRSSSQLPSSHRRSPSLSFCLLPAAAYRTRSSSVFCSSFLTGMLCFHLYCIVIPIANFTLSPSYTRRFMRSPSHHIFLCIGGMTQWRPQDHQPIPARSPANSND